MQEKNIPDINFVVGDEKMFHYEIKTKEYQAICSFNNKNFAQNLIKGFNEIWKS